MGWLSSLLALLYGIWQKFFSDPAQLKRRELAEAARKAQEEVEAERLKATYERIDREPEKSVEELVDRLGAPPGGVQPVPPPPNKPPVSPTT